MSESSPARELFKLISTALSTVETACEVNGSSIPDLHTPFHPSSEAFREDRAAAEAANVICAAALQLAAIFAPPAASLFQVVGGSFKSAAIRACLESNVTEILREGGPEGVHINEIGEKNGQDPQKIGRFLRLLATNHIYREVRPDVFTNTRISSMLDTHKSSHELFANPEGKHDNTIGMAAVASLSLDENFKAAAYSWETLADPKTAKSCELDSSPFSRAMGRQESLWQFYERPEEAFRQHRFNIAMQGVQTLQPVDAVLGAFDWKSLPHGAVVVDVAGGIGTGSLPLAREFTDLQIVVQDLPRVIDEAKQLWASQMPDALESGRVELEVQDIFKPQARRNVSVFLVKQVFHDWSDDSCAKILANLWQVASKDTKLVLMESLIPLACHDPLADVHCGIPGAVHHEAPEPLLPNYGAVNGWVYNMDIIMFLLFNAQERTFRHLDELLRSAGWKITLVRRSEAGGNDFLQSIEAVPIGKGKPYEPKN